MEQVNENIIKKIVTQTKCPGADDRFSTQKLELYALDSDKKESVMNVPAFSVWVYKGSMSRFNTLRDDIYND